MPQAPPPPENITATFNCRCPAALQPLPQRARLGVGVGRLRHAHRGARPRACGRRLAEGRWGGGGRVGAGRLIHREDGGLEEQRPRKLVEQHLGRHRRGEDAAPAKVGAHLGEEPQRDARLRDEAHPEVLVVQALAAAQPPARLRGGLSRCGLLADCPHSGWTLSLSLNSGWSPFWV